MKKLVPIICCLLPLCFSNCKKDENPFNITLYDKPVPTIKSYIGGKWKLHYDIGGLTGYIRHEYVNSFIEFKFQYIDSITEIHDSITAINSPIEWFKFPDLFTGDSTNLLGYNLSRSGLPFAYRVEKIYNDTLILNQPVADGYSFMLTRY